MIWGQPSSRVDERDTLFARMARRQGSPAYEDYYGRRADLKQGDDRLRALPELLQPGGAHFDLEICADTDRWFRAIDDIAPDPATVARLSARLTSAPDLTRGLEALASDLGAVASGACRLDTAFVYTYKGRFDRDYGQPVIVEHPSAFVFLVEMNFGQMRRVPQVRRQLPVPRALAGRAGRRARSRQVADPQRALLRLLEDGRDRLRHLHGRVPVLASRHVGPQPHPAGRRTSAVAGPRPGSHGRSRLRPSVARAPSIPERPTSHARYLSPAITCSTSGAALRSPCVRLIFTNRTVPCRSTTKVEG